MKEWKEITYYVGFDWAHDHHDVVIVDRRGQIVADFEIQHTAAGWQRWNQQVAALGAGAVAVCVETSQGLIIEQLLEGGVNVYPIAPVSSKAYRERKASSGTKTDRLDAWSLADALRLDGQGWKVLAKEDPLVAELRLLCRDEVALIEERTALVNQLQSALEQYYPAAREAFEDWTLPGGLGVCRSLSHPDGVACSRPTEMGKVPPRDKLARPQTYGKRLEIFARANEFRRHGGAHPHQEPPGARPHPMLRVLQTQIEAYRAEIEKLFAKHPDHQLFGSLPGAGPQIAPRLLGEIGSDRARFDEPSALQALAGTAPVSYQSGQIHKVYVRRRCNKSLRATIHLWANLSRRASPWAALYYQALRARRQIPCRRLALLRSALAQNPLQDVAHPSLLPSRSPHPQSTQTRLLDPPVATCLSLSPQCQ